jgi:hypothetical protein
MCGAPERLTPLVRHFPNDIINIDKERWCNTLNICKLKRTNAVAEP